MLMFLAIALVVAANKPPDLVDVKALQPRFILDIKYATTDNFTKTKLYPVARCLLRPEVAQMLHKAQKHLDDNHAGFTLMLKDCYRPQRVQEKMWKVVKGTSMQPYVADPYGKTGSVHNYGCAVDLTLADAQGKEVDMGAPYDHFGVLAEPRHERRFLEAGKLSAKQVERRRILRKAMVDGGGFKTIHNEWWHFDALQGAALRKKYIKLDIALDAEL